MRGRGAPRENGGRNAVSGQGQGADTDTERKHGTHLYREPSPSGADLEESVARLETERLEHVVDLPVLGRFEVAVRRVLEQAAADAALCVGPSAHEYIISLLKNAGDKRACSRCGSVNIWRS